VGEEEAAKGDGQQPKDITKCLGDKDFNLVVAAGKP